MTIETVASQALALSVQERAQLVCRLLDSIEPQSLQDPKQLEDVCFNEANRRYQAYLRGEEQAIPGTQALAELRAEDL